MSAAPTTLGATDPTAAAPTTAGLTAVGHFAHDDAASAVVAHGLAACPPITLAELNATAALQTRVDRKYVLTLAETAVLLDAVSPHARVLEIGGWRDSRYASTYFDSPDLLTFRLTARRRRRRFKVRTRTYLDTGDTFLEVKRRTAGGVTVKERTPHPVPDSLGPDGAAFVAERLGAAHLAAPPGEVLRPVLRSRYRRTTVLLPDARLTLDTNLTWLTPDGAHGHRCAGTVVVETKGGRAPSSADRLLWETGHRPDRLSKYATGLTVLHPHLPDHPWRRVRRERLHV